MVSSAGRWEAGACRSESIRLRDGLVGGVGAILGLVKSPTIAPPAIGESLLGSLLISLLAMLPAPPGVVGCDDIAEDVGSAGACAFFIFAHTSSSSSSPSS